MAWGNGGTGVRRGVPVALAVGLLLLAVLAPGGAEAHERRTVGKYLLVIGWAEEPAAVGLKNGLELGIFDTSTGNAPVSGAEGNLTAKFVYGAKVMLVDLLPIYIWDNTTHQQVHKAGYYGADIIPTAPGTYKVNLTGTIGTQAVNLEQALDDVTYPSAIEFPAPRPTPENLSLAVNNTEAIARIALIVGAVGIVLGVIGIAVALIYSRRHP